MLKRLLILRLVGLKMAQLVGQKKARQFWIVRPGRPWAALLYGTMFAVGLSHYGIAQNATGDVDVSALELSNAWVRAMPPTQRMTAAYLRIRNTGSQIVTIDAVTSPLGEASLHETRTEAGRSRMRPVPALQVPPQGVIDLAPGGLHIMLMGLQRMPAAGSTTRLCLRSDAGLVCTDARVQRDANSATKVKHGQHH